MKTMSKKAQREAHERSRGQAIDNLVVYLECTSTQPPTDVIYPLLNSALENAREVLPHSPVSVMEAPPRKIGIIGNSECKGYRHIVSTCEPMGREQLKRLAMFLPRNTHIMAPVGRPLVRVNQFQINDAGAVLDGLPNYYFSRSDKVAYWLPCFAPVALGTKRTHDAGGWKEGTVFESDADGAIPVIANYFLQASRLTWAVRISALSGRCHIVFPTNEAGVKGFYDLRNLPLTEGGRKAALRHFVTNHLRAKKTPVREHFRGKEEFEWFGMKCVVVPPEPLVARVDDAKAKG